MSRNAFSKISHQSIKTRAKAIKDFASESMKNVVKGNLQLENLRKAVFPISMRIFNFQESVTFLLDSEAQIKSMHHKVAFADEVLVASEELDFYTSFMLCKFYVLEKFILQCL
ncbi:hypothetical protein CEXT_581991 [Caerostris extrusa]|uniref:Reverse transcriptase domain-containing protein n=1 Tax=Caerostris extrusa TaxID=172846 RepID=A0AAV4MEE8_CAEEX|nr:hypothetical protein CEXT_581991 [Caerostris extrusa]